MAETYVTGETLVGEIVTQYPEAVEVLLSIGMHCLGCPASRAESLEDACAVHGRMIWDEQGRPGYGLYDRALGAAYINGLWEAIDKNHKG